MMLELFTLGELQQIYEIILGKELLDPAFRRIIADKVKKTDKMKTGGRHRPSALFRYKTRSKTTKITENDKNLCYNLQKNMYMVQ